MMCQLLNFLTSVSFDIFVIAYKGSDISTPQMSLPVFAEQVGENGLYEFIKVA